MIGWDLFGLEFPVFVYILLFTTGNVSFTLVSDNNIISIKFISDRINIWMANQYFVGIFKFEIS